jgi:hypothetical protein
LAAIKGGGFTETVLVMQAVGGVGGVGVAGGVDMSQRWSLFRNDVEFLQKGGAMSGLTNVV